MLAEKNLILGDSNLSRFPQHWNKHLQIDSFPGGNFRHAAAFISSATCSVAPRNIILAFGLNHRSQNARVTACKQLQAALKATGQRFPAARVMIPRINFSPSLSQQDKTNLSALNRFISEKCDFIDKLSDSLFHTEVDHIHWSRQTAQDMLKHWCSYLN